MNTRLARLGLPSTVALLLVIFGWLPARAAVQSAETQTDASTQLIETLTEEDELLTELEGSAANLDLERVAQEEAIPDTPQLPEFILALETLTNEVGAEVIDVVPTSILGPFDDPATPIGTSSVLLSVSLHGTFDQTIDLMDELVMLPRIVIVESVGLGTDDTASGLAIDLELRIFTTEELVDSTDGFLEDFDVDDDDGSEPVR